MVTSGVRLGTPAGTTRGFGTEEFRQVGHLIGDVLDGLASNRNDNSDIELRCGERFGNCAGHFQSINSML